MGQKEKIISLLKEKKLLTQGDLSMYLYGDRNHLPNLYASLMSLVKQKIVNRQNDHPAYYSLSEENMKFSRKLPAKYEKYNSHKIRSDNLNVVITNELIEEAHKIVETTDNYGREDKLITACFKRFPNNTDIDIVAMKIGLIDITNSTHVSQHKSKISVVELAESIVKIKDIDQRLKNGDPEVVNEISKCNGKINLFSFASKYCCYHNKNLYGKDDYSIFDTVLKKSLPLYFDDISESQIRSWQNSHDYKAYNDYITEKLDELMINVEFKKRKFDHFIWFDNRKITKK